MDIYCRVSIWGAPFTLDVSKPKSNKSNTMNLVDKRAWELGLCEDAFRGHDAPRRFLLVALGLP